MSKNNSSSAEHFRVDPGLIPDSSAPICFCFFLGGEGGVYYYYYYFYVFHSTTCNSLGYDIHETMEEIMHPWFWAKMVGG